MTKKPLAFVAVATLVLLATTAHGALEYNYEDQNLVFDPDTGLIWLPTNAQEEEVAELSQYGRNLRIATSFSQVTDLFVSNFGPPGEGPYNPALAEFMTFMGANVAPGFFGLEAWYFDSVIEQAYQGGIFEYTAVGDSWNLFVTTTLGPYDQPYICPDNNDQYCASRIFYVMNPVPIPPALLLMVSAVAALSRLSRTRSRAVVPVA